MTTQEMTQLITEQHTGSGVMCVNYDKIYLECDALKQAILRQVFE